MNWYGILWLVSLVITHGIAYYWGKADAPEPFKPSDQAWLAAQCHAIDKQYEYARWSEEREQAETAAPSGD